VTAYCSYRALLFLRSAVWLCNCSDGKVLLRRRQSDATLQNRNVLEAAADAGVSIQWAFGDDDAGAVALMRSVMTRCLHRHEGQRPINVARELSVSLPLAPASPPTVGKVGACLMVATAGVHADAGAGAGFATSSVSAPASPADSDVTTHTAMKDVEYRGVEEVKADVP
jgi:hypothetical protein